MKGAEKRLFLWGIYVDYRVRFRDRFCWRLSM